MKTHLNPIIAILTLALVSGCATPAKYHEPSHQVAYEQTINSDERVYPDTTLKVGEIRHFTTPAKSIAPHGWWLSVATEDPTIARALPVDGSFTNGTRIEGVAPGRTRAVYGNAAPLHYQKSAENNINFESPQAFWIEVVK